MDTSEYFDDWSSVLKGHPIFSSTEDTQPQQLELSTNSLPDFTRLEYDDSLSPSGRRQIMVLKDADLILAVGKELRVTSLGDAKLGRGKSESYKARVTVMPYRPTLTCCFRFYIRPISSLKSLNCP